MFSVGEAHLRIASVACWSVQVNDDDGIELAEARVHYVPAYEAAAAYDGAAARGWHLVRIARAIHSSGAVHNSRRLGKVCRGGALHGHHS